MNRYPLPLPIGVSLTSAAFTYGVTQAIKNSSPGWLLLPLAASVLLALQIGRFLRRRERRDEQLAQVVELPPTNGVDLSLIDLHRWADAGASDPRWRCDLEDDTGEKR